MSDKRDLNRRIRAAREEEGDSDRWVLVGVGFMVGVLCCLIAWGLVSL